MVGVRDGHSAVVLARPIPRIQHRRWSIPISAFVICFGIVLVTVTDPYSGAFADANTAPSHWEQILVGQTLATGANTKSGVITRDGFSSRGPAAPASIATASVGIPTPGSAQAIALAILTSEGMGQDQYACLVNLWNRESHWRVNAANPDGAYGIPQALPGSKMAADGPDWQTNATTQINWGLGYIAGRYGTPCGAWAHSQATGWY